MIKFFRKIRYNLMEQNKTGKYFKYAIGEIVLVMIGILLALQVNNWNEARKNRLLELIYLENITADLNLNINELQEFIASRETCIKASDSILKNFEEYVPEYGNIEDK